MRKKVNNTAHSESSTTCSSDLFNPAVKKRVTRKPKDLPEKYCPNCGDKHQVHEEPEHLDADEKIPVTNFYIICPDEFGEKKYGIQMKPDLRPIVYKDGFYFTKSNQQNIY